MTVDPVGPDAALTVSTTAPVIRRLGLPSGGRNAGQRYPRSVGSPYRSDETEGRKLEPDPAPARRVRRAAAAAAFAGVSIGATTPVLGLGAAALGAGVALLGLFLLREATGGAMKAPCPSCGAQIGEVDPAVEAVLCASCGEYARTKNGALVALREEHVADAPLFAIPIAVEVPTLPPVCAECGAPAAGRLVPVEAPSYPGRVNHSFSMAGEPVVLVPHCDRHRNGAEVSSTTLRVRSYAFWLATRAARPLSSSQGGPRAC